MSEASAADTEAKKGACHMFDDESTCARAEHVDLDAAAVALERVDVALERGLACDLVSEQVRVVRRRDLRATSARHARRGEQAYVVVCEREAHVLRGRRVLRLEPRVARRLEVALKTEPRQRRCADVSSDARRQRRTRTRARTALKPRDQLRHRLDCQLLLGRALHFRSTLNGEQVRAF